MRFKENHNTHGITVNSKTKYSMSETQTKNTLTLKWGTLKSWHLDGEAQQKLMKEYCDIGY